tara:strand:+ start:652 stop:1923 length:1272 start_codon:yes stop_codon:yes gene_type:complete
MTKPKHKKKIKVLTLSDHPLFATGVAIQTRLFIESLLQAGNFEIVSLAGAAKHADMSPIRTEQYGDKWKIFPVEGYGSQEIVRSVMRTEKPDVMWLMTDPRYWNWLWEMEDEVRAQVPMVYYHVWDNTPAPHFNKKYYDSNDVVVSISKLTESVVNEVGTTAKHIRIPHTYDPDVFKKLPSEEVDKFKSEHFGEELKNKTLFFWNNRNSPRKNPTTMLWWFKEYLDDVGHDKATLLIHTDPRDPMGTDLEQNITELGLGEGQVMVSPLKYPPDRMAMLYNVADCTINISDAEGFGLSTLESLACGTPIIVTNTGGLSEQITDGKNTFGVAINPSTRTVIGSHAVPYIHQDRISKKDFISALKSMSDMSPEQRQEMGRLGKKYVEKEYNINNYAKSWTDTITSVCKQGGSWDNRKYKNWELLEL